MPRLSTATSPLPVLNVTSNSSCLTPGSETDIQLQVSTNTSVQLNPGDSIVITDLPQGWALSVKTPNWKVSNNSIIWNGSSVCSINSQEQEIDLGITPSSDFKQPSIALQMKLQSNTSNADQSKQASLLFTLELPDEPIIAYAYDTTEFILSNPEAVQYPNTLTCALLNKSGTPSTTGNIALSFNAQDSLGNAISITQELNSAEITIQVTKSPLNLNFSKNSDGTWSLNNVALWDQGSGNELIVSINGLSLSNSTIAVLEVMFTLTGFSKQSYSTSALFKTVGPYAISLEMDTKGLGATDYNVYPNPSNPSQFIINHVKPNLNRPPLIVHGTINGQDAILPEGSFFSLSLDKPSQYNATDQLDTKILYCMDKNNHAITSCSIELCQLPKDSQPPLNLSGLDLTGQDLSKWQLNDVVSGGIIGTPTLPEHYSLIKGYIVGPNANLSNADLSNADLSNADLRNAKLDGVISGGIIGATGRAGLPENYRITNGYIDGVISGIIGATGRAGLPENYRITNGYIVGPNVNLSKADLSKAELEGALLSNANLSGANLQKAHLEGANLSNADLSGANLQKADLERANLSNTNLSGTDLSNVVYLKGVVSGGIIGTPTLPNGYRLINGYIVGPDIDLSDADLSKADLSNISFGGANLKNAKLDGVISGGIIGRPILPKNYCLTKGYIIGPKANVSNADLSNANLSNVDLFNVDLQSVKLDGVVSGGITGTPTLPDGYRLINGYIVGPNVNLSNSNLSNAKLPRANLSNSNLSNANLSNADLSNANLSNTNLSNAKLDGVISGGIIGTPTLPNGYSLINGYIVGSNANLSRATLLDANLSNAKLDGIISGGIIGTPTLPNGYSLINGYIVGPNINLSNAKLLNANLNNTKLDGIISGGITGTPTLPDGYSLINGYIVGPNVNLSNANLSNFDLSNANLSNTNLSNAKLDGVISGRITGTPTLPDGYSLINGYIVGPNINLSNANLKDAKLDGVISGGITGRPTLPDGYMLHKGYIVGPNVNLSNANLSNFDLSNANLSNTNLSNAKLDGVISGGIIGTPTLPNGYSLINGYIVGPNANLSRATLTNVDLKNAKLDGVISEGIIGTPTLPNGYSLINGYIVGPNTNLSNAHLYGVNLSNANLSNANLSNAILSNANLSNVDLSNTDLLNADLPDTDLPFANLKNANLSNANLQNANLSNANLSNANLSNANLSNANLSNANLNGVISKDIKGTPILPNGYFLINDYIAGPDVNLSNADLPNANLSNADLSNANLSHTNLWNANLSNTNLSNAKLDGVISKDIKGTPTLPNGYSLRNNCIVGG